MQLFSIKICFYIKNSAAKTTTQQMQAVGRRPAPKKAAIIPIIRAIIPASVDSVA